jgi:hypothetical protein
VAIFKPLAMAQNAGEMEQVNFQAAPTPPNEPPHETYFPSRTAESFLTPHGVSEPHHFFPWPKNLVFTSRTVEIPLETTSCRRKGAPKKRAHKLTSFGRHF